MNCERANNLLFGILSILFFTTTQSMEHVAMSSGTQVVPYNCSSLNTAPGHPISSFLQTPATLDDRLQRAFFSSISSDSPLTIKCYLDLGIDVTTRDASGRNALHWAAEHNSINVAAYLLQKGIPVHAKYDFDIWTGYGINALHIAASNGIGDFVKLLLEHGAIIDARDDKGRTALHRAAAAGYEDVVLLLLEHGALVNARYDTSWLWSTGTTALHEAVGHGYKNIAKLLIAGAALVDSRDPQGKIALHIAVENNDREMVQIILAAQPDLEIRDFDGKNALDSAIDLDNQDVIELLARAGARVLKVQSFFPFCGVRAADTMKEHDCESLSQAIENWDLSRWFLDKKPSEAKSLFAPASTQDISTLYCDEPLLIKAARHSDPQMVKELLAHGAPVNEAMRDGLKITGVTALHEAAYWGNIRTVEELIKGQAAIDAPLKTGGMEALKSDLGAIFGFSTGEAPSASEQYSMQVEKTPGGVKFLKPNNPSFLEVEATEGESDSIVRKFKEDFRLRRERGHWDLHAPLLMDQRIDSNLKMFEGFTALHFALLNRHKAVVDHLLEKNATVPGEDLSFLAPFKETQAWAWNALGDYYAYVREGEFYGQAKFYVIGKKIERRYCDYPKAFNFYEKAVNQDVNKEVRAWAWVSIGHLYMHGLGVRQDYVKAKEFYEMAASQGDNQEAQVWGWYGLGLLYHEAWGVPGDYVKAKEYFERAAGQKVNKESQTKAWRRLGDLHYKGQGVPKNYEQAHYYYKLVIDSKVGDFEDTIPAAGNLHVIDLIQKR